MPKAPPLEPILPIGAAFAVPLDKGQFAVCRVIARGTPSEAGRIFASKEDRARCVLVLATRWVGTRAQLAKALRDPRVRKPLKLTHHSQRNKPYVILVTDPPPRSFVRLGEIAPTPAEQKLPNVDFAWATFRDQYRAQLAWEADPDAVRARDKARWKAEMAALEREREEIKARRNAARRAQRARSR